MINYLSQYRRDSVVYIPNPGNAGDSIIAAATYQLLNRAGLKYELARADKVDPDGRVVIYGGGGNLVAPNTFSAKTARRLHRRAKRFVVLPHTIKDNNELLQQFEGNVDVFCREQYSFDYVRKSGTRAKVFLAGDMAFGLGLGDLQQGANISMPQQFSDYAINKLRGRISTPMLSNLNRALHCDAILLRLQQQAPRRHLNCFRLDDERTAIDIPKDNVDLSQELQFGVENAALAKYCAASLVKFLGGYASVSTNRLHIAISAALVGLDVRFYSNSYYKCKGVYEFSMRGVFDNVSWMSD